MSHFLTLLNDKALFEHTLFLIPLFPLLGFLLNGMFGKQMDKKASGWIGVMAALASFIWAFLSVRNVGLATDPNEIYREALHAVYGTWLNTGDFNVSFGLYLDQLSSVMILVVTGIGTLIHIYSLGYMSHDEGFSRFFAYLNLFLFAMILLVLGDSLMVLFVGWEGVGLCSYLLIGFWYEDGKNAAAGMKAFIVNRIGDLGFILGIFTLLAAFGTVNFAAQPKRAGGKHMTPKTYQVRAVDEKDKGRVMLPNQPGLLDYADALRFMGDTEEHKDWTAGFKADPDVSNLDLSHTMAAKTFSSWNSLKSMLVLACIFLFIGATGKSAQIPLFVWLPDAMAGPTPVSALIHAATMVTAGIYMICRLHGLFAISEDVLLLIAVIGGTTALFSALIGLTQLDIKKVLAYSTVSQLGYMFLGLGVGAFSLGIFHVLTHAFFKALLFLGAGSVIHAMSGEQDMRYMGGLRKKLPLTFWTMLVGAFALAGIFPFAGWWSKDAILACTLAKYEETHSKWFLMLYVFGVAGAFCTAFYTFRLICLTFFGESRAKPEVQAHIHESPPEMTFPLVALATLSLIGGYVWHDMFTTNADSALAIRNVSVEPDHHIHLINLFVTTVIAVAGVVLACIVYGKNRKVPDPEKAMGNPFYKSSYNKFYIDEIYDTFIITPFRIASELGHWMIDMLLIDTLVTGVGYLTSFISGKLRKVQTGLMNSYAAAILLGALAVLFFLMQ